MPREMYRMFALKVRLLASEYGTKQTGIIVASGQFTDRMEVDATTRPPSYLKQVPNTFSQQYLEMRRPVRQFHGTAGSVNQWF